ncbi:MAG TPA: hypothetical protein VFS34_00585 [Thermoanaerobaculia bacterium]|nr:hypothetical protein [Thermoanaerobaculia bacterium]
MKRGIVWFAPTLGAARRARQRAEGTTGHPDGAASPRATADLVRALSTGEPVRVVDPPRPSASWERAKRKILLPAAPGLLRDAIGGIAAQEPPPGGENRRGGPTRAHWIPGDLTDERAAALLGSPPVPSLWIVEDFRKLRLSAGMRARVEREGVGIAAYRALSPFRARRRRARRGRIGR